MTEPNPIEALAALESEALAAIAAAADADAVEAARITYLGRSEGRISAILRGLGALAPEERPAVGQEANRVKGVVTAALDERTRELAVAVNQDGFCATFARRAEEDGLLAAGFELHAVGVGTVG